MIDQKKVKQFWDERATVLGKVAIESVANLEQDKDNLKLKIDDETSKVFDWLPNILGLSVLDLGAGVGQWAFRFAERGASRVLAVEYAQGLADIGTAESKRRGFDQVEFQVSSAEHFDTQETFDIVYISGLFVYLNDDQAELLSSKLHRFVRARGFLMIRDGTGILGRHEIDDRFSEHLAAQYSATYRTRNEYVSSIERRGFKLLRDENMFPEGHLLNKYSETRLRLFLFEKHF